MDTPQPRVRRGYVETKQGGQIHYHAAGESGALVFFFHETALSGSEFLRVLPIVGRTYRAVALDTPGYGLSDAPSAPLTMDAMTAIAAEAMERFGPGPYILAGAHTGACVALSLAVDRMTKCVSHLMLTGVPLLSDNEKAMFRTIAGKQIIDPDGQFLLEMWNRTRDRWGRDKALDDIFWGTMEQLRVYKRLAWAFETIFSYAVEDALRRVSCPALFLVGENDSLFGSDKRAVTLTPNAEIETVEGGPGRLPYFEPEIYSQQLLQFVRRR